MILSMLNSTEIDYVKYAVYLLRVYYSSYQEIKPESFIIKPSLVEIFLKIVLP